MYGFMTAEKFLAYCSEIRGRLDAATARKYAQRFDVRLDRKLKEYSKGNRQKIALILAFMSDPDLIIMDEPTSGLDPLIQQTFQEIVREEAKAGRTFRTLSCIPLCICHFRADIKFYPQFRQISYTSFLPPVYWHVLKFLFANQ
jgi:ABC-type multidrug transport system ATPase subunit